MSHRDLSDSATVVFDDDGRPTTMTADRYAREHGAVVPWSTPLTEYGEFGGVRVPTAGEAPYRSADGDLPYNRLRITDMAYDVPYRY